MSERQRSKFYKGERRRFSHYYQLDKNTPISSFADELTAVLNLCQADLKWRMSAVNLARLKEEAADLAKSGFRGDDRQLVERIEALLAQIAPVIENRPTSTPMPIPGQTKKVFLSYKFVEKELVEGLIQLLQNSRFEVVTGQAANTYISKAVIERIRLCDYFFCLMTQGSKKEDGTYTTSAWLLEEKGVALAFAKPIVLMVEEGSLISAVCKETGNEYILVAGDFSLQRSRLLNNSNLTLDRNTSLNDLDASGRPVSDH